ncbi:hypothetical protein [Methanoculleus oceani]|uniref:hypothetical protein n=1 Tax=Methanoculleus oceani TaxID=2184756 RepID=UPI002033DAAB|nr:hypothetical protein [Methanoculleus sp. CWC-02]
MTAKRPLTAIEVFGGDVLFDERLITSGGRRCREDDHPFGSAAAGTAACTPGPSASLALAVTKSTTPGGSSGGAPPAPWLTALLTLAGAALLPRSRR